jgi:hypothetical protein
MVVRGVKHEHRTKNSSAVLFRRRPAIEGRRFADDRRPTTDDLPTTND